MRHEKPLMFISSPVIRKYRYTPIVEEESTSVFEPEHSRELERPEVLPVPESLSAQESQESPEIQQELLATHLIRQRLEYLQHPFRKELYAPLEIITIKGSVKGKFHDLENEIVWINSNKEITSVRIEEILDILWKQQSFTI
ncbi:MULTISPECIES: hypothetical protein [unclassified Sporosarcina]|uniref:hypothetical protein n=1 Tax=unclassified Sporosarcina TaxID=2647733 RepID=UPI000C172CE7|nr:MULTISPECIES: hypothetical protein [unclassified Sporosarcina]PIC97980.1 hypothetical protein CSV68_15490 [Sporosarcina sp. P29]PID03889.1 hypothetical protein CSV66_15600 [Sporosarcina sp. P30]PID07490.1 hypothetical protein CSV65_15785 [Sporosarcina sp. P31]PID10704.1 hypothetical protein CSV64_15725 [Sporosarcina sp. P32b]